MERAKILVVDDEPTLCEGLKFNLELEGYDVDTAYSAEEALSLNISEYSLILLDVMMGEISGFSMARVLKKNPALAKIPIIFCTAKGNEDDMIKGLEIGADDYIAKPYSIRNVLARVKTVLRRADSAPLKPTDSSDVVTYENLSVDPELKRCEVDGQIIKLPRKEFEILYLLLSNKGKIFSRESIIKKVWPDEIVVLERVVDVNITRLRAKIGRYGKNIITRSGYGYGFEG